MFNFDLYLKRAREIRCRFIEKKMISISKSANFCKRDLSSLFFIRICQFNRKITEMHKCFTEFVRQTKLIG